MRSLTLLAGLDDSSLATISAPHDWPATLEILTRGVRPMSSRMLLAIFGLSDAKRAVLLPPEDTNGAKELLNSKRDTRVEASRKNFIVESSRSQF